MSESRLSQEDIEHIACELRNFGIVIELDIPPITKTRFRAKVRGEWVPFGKQDVEAIEVLFGEPLSLINCVVPYALPCSLAVLRLPIYEWKRAVQEDRTTLGRDDWARAFLRERTLVKLLEHWEKTGVRL